MDNQPSAEPVGDVWKYNPEYHKVTDFLGVDKYDREDHDLASKVSYLVDWAADKGGAKDFQGALNAINGLRKESGVQYQGKALVNQLYQFARLGVGKTQSSPVKQPAKGLSPKPQGKNTIVQDSVTKMMKPLQKTIDETVKGTVNNMIKQSLGELIK